MKLLLAIPLLALMMSCGGTAKSSVATQDSVKVDSNAVAPKMCNVSGVAIDGAMNSILLKTSEGDTLSFGYPELPPSQRIGWMIGDTVTISYVHVGGMDSVTLMRKGCFK